ncbi:DNA cytosine methyltransferase [Salinigranum halophilum]|uniref:DNA cytosine methyltransferase n=1 Tax=Salinigranum halophilum TaxID=2565931 RepID=UPI0010A7A8DE|nr:DNA cytosine methyltransferase [Salinigranum halophilum]
MDLFCGVGGLTRGLQQAGLSVEAGIEIDPACRHAYESNNDSVFLEQDVSTLRSDNLEAVFPDGSTKVLAGCAPCQPFSNLNNGEDTTKREEYGLLSKFGELVEDVQPTVVTMENVAEVTNESVYSQFMDVLFREGYHIWFDTVECPNYGVPQRRKRFILVASKLGEISLVDPTHAPIDFPTVDDAIGDLPPIEAGGVDNNDTLHRAQSLVDRNVERIRQSKPGGTWHDWDPEVRLDCHRKESGRSYESVYGRMEWDAPAPTMTTQFYNYGSGRFGHPEQDRALSLREGAMLQTFPRDYEFVADGDDVEFKKIGRFIGNAVPVKLGEAVGVSIKNHLEEHSVAT